MSTQRNVFYHGDCELVLRRDIEPESVDLIYLDPPFYTGQVQRGQWSPGAMEVSYDDTKRFWAEQGLHDTAPAWLKYIAGKDTERAAFAAYLHYMMVRLELCHRALKKTGSIYLHCDWRASHYLKMVMDEVFGVSRFMGDIIWHRANKIPDTTKRLFYKAHDNILFYAKSSSYTFTPLTLPTGTMVRRRKMQKVNGRIANTSEYIEYERRLPLTKSVISDIPDIAMSAVVAGKSERTGYPTQKPIALLERIITASSNEGDLVLDPFAGCGTTIMAAHKLRRFWIGIDLNREAYDVLEQRFQQLPLEALTDPVHGQHRLVCRDLEATKGLNAREFEAWVNDYYRATKPSPDRGIDGITAAGIPIQTKAWQSGKVQYETVNSFYMNAQTHPAVPKPTTVVRLVSQTGFDDSARQAAYEIERKFDTKVELQTPEDLIGAAPLTLG